MKKFLPLVIAMVVAFEGFSQTYASWDFRSGTTTTFPAGFVRWDLDGQAPNASAGFPASMDSFWAVFPTQTGANNGLAACASWFTSATIPCNRWLVTPDVNIPTGVSNVCLQWQAFSGDGNAPESYNVLISTTDSATGSFSSTYGITISAENGAATTRILPLAHFAGQRVRIAFQCTTTNGYYLGLNYINVINLPSYLASINDVEIYEHNYIGNAVPVTGTMTNGGFDTINNFTLNYSVNGAAAVTANVTGAGLVPQQSYYYTHSTVFNPTTAGTYNIKVWFSQLNGTSASSDTSSVTVFYYPQVPGLTKNVLIEEMTGAGCPWCPGGALALRDVHDNLSYVIPVAIHSADINDLGITPAANADRMQIANGQTVVTQYASGFPSGMVDRLYSFDNGTISPSFINDYYRGPSQVSQDIWDTLSIFRKNQATPCNVSLSNITFDSTSSSNNLSVSVNATFLNSLSQGTYNVNLYLVEDSLIITGNGYDQDNGAYSSAGGQTTNYNELYNLAAVLVDDGRPNDYSQNHVLRAMVGGPWGQTGVIPSAPQAGQTYSHTFTTTVPNTWRYKFVHLVGVVQESNSNFNLRTVLNATEAWLLQPNGIKATSELNKLTIYPNPAASFANVELEVKNDATVTISVVNLLGETVTEPISNLLNAGTHTLPVSVAGLSTGLYTVKISVNGEVTSMPLSVTGK